MRLGDQHDLRQNASGDVAKPHRERGTQPDVFDIAQQFALAGEPLRRFVARDSERFRVGDDGAHPGVDRGDRDPVDIVDGISRREQCAGTPAAELAEHHVDRRRAPGHTADLESAGIPNLSSGGGHRNRHGSAGVDQMDPDRGVTVNRCDKSALDRERPHPGEDVPARRCPIHPHGFDIHLREEIVDVAAGTGRRTHYRDLAGR